MLSTQVDTAIHPQVQSLSRLSQNPRRKEGSIGVGWYTTVNVKGARLLSECNTMNIISCPRLTYDLLYVLAVADAEILSDGDQRVRDGVALHDDFMDFGADFCHLKGNTVLRYFISLRLYSIQLARPT